MATYTESLASNASANVLASLARTDSTKAKSAMQDEQSRFLMLLTTQLRNQDPMNPLENSDLTMQLAQMSTVDGIERLNKLVQSLISSSEVSDSAALIGHGVLVEGKGLGLTEAVAIGGFEVDAPADKVVVTVVDANGIPVKTLEFNDVTTGSHNYMWDGLADDGSEAAQGMYTVKVAASLNGAVVNARPLEFGPVTSVVRGANGADLQVGALGIFKLEDIKQIL